MFSVVVLSNEILLPSTTNVPSMSVLSKSVVPSTLKLPLAVMFATVPILPADEPTLNSNISPSSFQPIRALSELPLSISTPASCDGVPVSSLFKTILLSPTVNVFDSIVVVEP